MHARRTSRPLASRGVIPQVLGIGKQQHNTLLTKSLPISVRSSFMPIPRSSNLTGQVSNTKDENANTLACLRRAIPNLPLGIVIPDRGGLDRLIAFVTQYQELEVGMSGSRRWMLRDNIPTITSCYHSLPESQPLENVTVG